MDTQELLQRGIDRYKQRDYENALEDFNQVISLNPTLAKAYHYRGWIYTSLKKKEEAIQNLQHAASIFKDREYSVLCKKIIALLDQLFPSKKEEKDSENNDDIYSDEYSNLFWIDEAGNLYHTWPDPELSEAIEDYYCYIKEDLQTLQNFTFQRLQRIELLQIKREKNAKFEPESLEKNGLPMCNSHQEIARLMRISVKVLRFFAFSRKKTAYNCFQIPKKTGGNRKISAPRPLLKKSQQWILHNILEKIEVHNAAHGFCLNHSIVTNAQPHVGANIVINFDLKDFFPSISYPRVKGLFKSFGYSETASIIFGLLCTEPTLKQIELDGEIHWLLSWTERHLPQGAPTSPAITNLLCRTLDKRLTQMAKRYGFVYTRYADDLTFSACGDSLGNIANLMKGTRSIVKSEGFNINEEKTRLLRKSRQQEVTGIVVNDKVNVSREKLKRFRATLYQIEKDGLIGKHWGDSKKRDLIPSLEGFANFVFMVNPEKGSLFREQVKRIKEKYAKRKYSTSNPLPQILNQSDLIGLIYAELTRLGATGKWRRLYLKYTYGKQSLQELTEENLLEFLTYLKSCVKSDDFIY
jgi:RNA-directed DNA polymerase